jgi:Protein of unknown function (DUF3047)
MRSSAPLLLALVAACAGTPDDPLVWSDEIARALPRERGDTVEVARFSRVAPGTTLEPWEPWFVQRGSTPTDYRLVEVDGATVLEADAQEGGSGVSRKIRVDPKRHPVLEWRWRVPADTGTRLEAASGASPLARLSLAFHGDANKLDFDDRAKLRLAMLLTANGLPYASLLYVWMLDVPAETVIRSPFTDRVRMIVVESGAQRAGEWVTVRRNVLEDYRRAFGEEAGDVVAVGLMTDPGDDGSRRRGFYGDITFRSGK